MAGDSEQGAWDEYDVAELGRLMVAANQLEDGIEDVNLPIRASDDDHEALRDAVYHAHKAYRLIARLAIKAQAAFEAQEQDERR